MGGIWQGDVIIKAMLERGLEDLRKNDWLINHALESLMINPYIADRYGKANIEACKTWFKNNKIDIYMRPRNDKDLPPCITITPGSAPEKIDMKHMADLSVNRRLLLPLEIGKPIPFVVKPFIPVSYDSSTGEVGINPDTIGFGSISPGMILVNPTNGEGYVIIGVNPGIINVEAGLNIDASQLAVVPKHSFYEARIEHAFFQENYTIGCWAHGDVQTLIWLHTLVMYTILRYRESLLEAAGFAESSVSSGEILEDPNYEGPGGELGFVRLIQLTGQTESSWLKQPHRFIETVVIEEPQCDEFIGGIRILSNLNIPATLNAEDETWYTVDSAEQPNFEHNDDFNDE